MNMQAIMKQAQAMQRDMLKAKEEIDAMEFTGESSLVKVTVKGTKEVVKVEINKDSDLTADELEILEDMILVATNQALKQVDEITEKKLGKYTNSLPGLF